MVWSEEIHISSHDVDYNGFVTPTAIVRYMMECANTQVNVCGPSNESLRENGEAFLLNRFSLEVKKPLFAYDHITVRTWGCPSQRLLFHRCFEILREGELVARGHAVMALIDIHTRKLLRTDHYHPNFDYEPDFEVPIDDHMSLPRTNDDMNLLGRYVVGYGVCDQNRHMNNTRYYDTLLSFVDTEGKWLKSITIHFVQEAPMGEEMTVYGTLSPDGDSLLRTMRPDGQVNCEAKIIMA